MERVTDEQLLELNEKYGYFQFGDAQGAKSRAFANEVADYVCKKRPRGSHFNRLGHQDVCDRLNSDGHFRALVDQLEYILGQGYSTPSELREALIVAATRHEYRTIRPLLVDPSEWCLEKSVLAALGKKESDSDKS